jgi:hypothetical protein
MVLHTFELGARALGSRQKVLGADRRMTPWRTAALGVRSSGVNGKLQAIGRLVIYGTCLLMQGCIGHSYSDINLSPRQFNRNAWVRAEESNGRGGPQRSRMKKSVMERLSKGPSLAEVLYELGRPDGVARGEDLPPGTFGQTNQTRICLAYIVSVDNENWFDEIDVIFDMKGRLISVRNIYY